MANHRYSVRSLATYPGLFFLFSSCCAFPVNQLDRSSTQCHSSSTPSLLLVSGRASVSLSAFARESDRNDRGDRNQPTNDDGKGEKRRPPRKVPKSVTLADVSRELKKEASSLRSTTQKNNKKTGRTRKRVENPKQQYLYASQRRALEQAGAILPRSKKRSASDSGSGTSVGDHADQDDHSTDDRYRREVYAQAKEFGLIPATQHCDPLVDNEEPRVVGQLLVGNNGGSGSFAYLIEKPPGWSIVGSGGSVSDDRPGPQASLNAMDSDWSTSTRPNLGDSLGHMDNRDHLEESQHAKYVKQIRVQDAKGNVDVIEYNELDMLALLTPEELEEYLSETGMELPPLIKKTKRRTSEQQLRHAPSPMDGDDTDDSTDRTTDDNGVEAYGEERQTRDQSLRKSNLKRIAARAATWVASEDTAEMSSRFASYVRPSVVGWLKQKKQDEGIPIRGGNHWTAVVGAIDVDDSGLVLICPKEFSANVFVEYAEYVAVTGTGGFMAPEQNLRQETGLSNESIRVSVLSRLRIGRIEDALQILRIYVPERKSTCGSVVSVCQRYTSEGVRGDPAANAFDRRAWRRLIHCNSISVSSLYSDDHITDQIESLPDDISVYADRHTSQGFMGGSFLGRSSLRDGSLTNAYREVNGAADGFPGWTLDRYGYWLLAQHDPKLPRGPLPSMDDGNTAGVYYIESSQYSNSATKQSSDGPRLLHGRPAPEVLEVMENGVKYLVSLDRDLSARLFLDQRAQRAWLTRNCCQDTQVLNFFAYNGAFSVAAAAAGASTVSISLSRKWLDQLPDNLRANGIEYNERHDSIFGDSVYDWMEKLASRGEKYDIVILDPPSWSMGVRKKKQWSVRNDMDDLVALAVKLVKKGGLLWTMTYSASIHPIKFARQCRKGFETAGIMNAKLERIQPMPVDFLSIGPQPAKNLVWRIP